jgi:hypothetical protein
MLSIALPIQVENEIQRVLSDLYPKWHAFAPADIKRHVQWEGTSLSFGLVEHRGRRTWVEFSKSIAQEIDQFESILVQHAPVFLGFICTPQMSMRLQSQAWLWTWVQYLEKCPEESLSDKISTLLRDLKRLLAGGGKTIATTILKGLTLPEFLSDIRLELGGKRFVTLHRLSEREFSELHSTDDLFSSNDLFSIRESQIVILLERDATLSFQNDPTVGLVTEHFAHDVQRVVSDVVQALTIVKESSFSAGSTSYRTEPNLIPGLSGLSTLASGPRFFSSIDLTSAEAEELRVVFERMRDARPEIGIAAKRLVDAESRANPADAIVDSAIGLETLLLRDRQELTYRVKLNYAFLAPFSERRDRISELNELYAWRGKVVHGSAGDASVEALQAVAKKGKAALRDVITRFLRDPTLRKDAKLDNDFWIDRIVRG